jgi:metallo-beta-lactamase class B
MKQSTPFVVSIIFSVVAVFSTDAQKLPPVPYADSSWTKPYKPFRVAGNLYYVGTYDLSSYLITTQEGHILINTGLAESVPMIKKNIESLGFRFSDIKILLTNQGHYDHVAGMAQIHKLTGAKIMIHKGDSDVLRDGGASDYVFGGNGATFEPVEVSRVLRDGDLIKLGETSIQLLHHPGHTKGASSFLFTTKDEFREWRILVANMPTILSAARIYGMPRYPDIGPDFKKTLSSLPTLEFDLWVAAHASQFKLHEKRKEDEEYRPEAFADHVGFNEAIGELQKEYERRLQTDK